MADARTSKPTAKQQRIIESAVAQLQSALIDKGLDPSAALRFARVALSKFQGASVGKGGVIRYKGKTYNAKDFAATPLIDYVTGAKAKADNIAAIHADPNYQQTVAQLGLTRDQSLADLEQSRRSNLIDFGDSNFVQNDPVLAAAIEANPFSTSKLLREGYERDQGAVRNTANRAGTLLGGGLISGMREAQRQFAGQNAQATRTLSDFLTQTNQQTGNLGQDYVLGERAALLQAQQALTQANLLKPEGAPSLKGGVYQWWRPPPVMHRNGTPPRGGQPVNAPPDRGPQNSGNNGSIPNPPHPPTANPIHGGGKPIRPGANPGRPITSGVKPIRSGPNPGRPIPGSESPTFVMPPLFHRRHRIPAPTPPLFHRKRRGV